MNDDDLDLGRSFNTHHHASAADIRRTLEERASDPELAAFGTLVAPNASHLARLLPIDERRGLGRIALERYCTNGGSVMPHDYRDLLDGIHDPYAFEWSALRPLVPSPCGFGGSR